MPPFREIGFLSDLPRCFTSSRRAPLFGEGDEPTDGHDDTIIYTLSLQGTCHVSGTVFTCEVGTSAVPIFQGRKLKFKEGL